MAVWGVALTSYYSIKYEKSMFKRYLCEKHANRAEQAAFPHLSYAAKTGTHTHTHVQERCILDSSAQQNSDL